MKKTPDKEPEMPDIVKKALDGIKDRYPKMPSLKSGPKCPEHSDLVAFVHGTKYSSEHRKHIFMCSTCKRMVEAIIEYETNTDAFTDAIAFICSEESRDLGEVELAKVLGKRFELTHRIFWPVVYAVVRPEFEKDTGRSPKKAHSYLAEKVQKSFKLHPKSRSGSRKRV